MGRDQALAGFTDGGHFTALRQSAARTAGIIGFRGIIGRTDKSIPVARSIEGTTAPFSRAGLRRTCVAAAAMLWAALDPQSATAGATADAAASQGSRGGSTSVGRWRTWSGGH